MNKREALRESKRWEKRLAKLKAILAKKRVAKVRELIKAGRLRRLA
jgi:hypothetical protein